MSDAGDIRYVIRGALVECDKGSRRSRLNLPKSHGAYFKDDPIMVDTDREPNVNIMPFGKCKVLGGPCKPEPDLYWRDVKQDTVIKGRPALLTRSILICTVGGTISVTESGQEG